MFQENGKEDFEAEDEFWFGCVGNYASFMFLECTIRAIIQTNQMNMTEIKQKINEGKNVDFAKKMLNRCKKFQDDIYARLDDCLYTMIKKKEED